VRRGTFKVKVKFGASNRVACEVRCCWSVETRTVGFLRGGNVKRQTRSLCGGLGLCSLLFALALAFVLLGCGKEQKVEPQAPIVEVAEVAQKDVPVFAEWVGTLDGSVNATIRAQVQGYLVKQNYKEGDFVRKGQVLFEIDPRSTRQSSMRKRPY